MGVLSAFFGFFWVVFWCFYFVGSYFVFVVLKTLVVLPAFYKLINKEELPKPAGDASASGHSDSTHTEQAPGTVASLPDAETASESSDELPQAEGAKK